MVLSSVVVSRRSPKPMRKDFIDCVCPEQLLEAVFLKRAASKRQ